MSPNQDFIVISTENKIRLRSLVEIEDYYLPSSTALFVVYRTRWKRGFSVTFPSSQNLNLTPTNINCHGGDIGFTDSLGFTFCEAGYFALDPVSLQ